MAQTRSSPLIVFRFSRWHLSLALQQQNSSIQGPQVRGTWESKGANMLSPDGGCFGSHSLVIKLMNSDTHSCTVSLASLAIFAFAGRAFFIILLIFAMGRNRSCSRTFPPLSSSSPKSAPLLLINLMSRQACLLSTPALLRTYGACTVLLVCLRYLRSCCVSEYSACQAHAH